MANDRRPRVRQLRLVVEAPDYEAAVRFYRDVLGLEEELAVAGPDGAHVTILAAGRATLELANTAQSGSSTRSRSAGRLRRRTGSRSRWTTPRTGPGGWSTAARR